MVVGCVVLIGVGPSLEGGESKYDTSALLTSIGLALGTGFLFSINAININYIIQTIGFSADQLNYDGAFVYGLALIPPYIYESINGTFTTKDIVSSNMAQVMVTIAVVFMSYALKYGKGANVQAIENMKSVIQTIIVAMFVTRVIPGLVEIAGMLLGVAGVILIVLT